MVKKQSFSDASDRGHFDDLLSLTDPNKQTSFRPNRGNLAEAGHTRNGPTGETYNWVFSPSLTGVGCQRPLPCGGGAELETSRWIRLTTNQWGTRCNHVALNWLHQNKQIIPAFVTSHFFQCLKSLQLNSGSSTVLRVMYQDLKLPACRLVSILDILFTFKTFVCDGIDGSRFICWIKALHKSSGQTYHKKCSTETLCDYFTVQRTNILRTTSALRYFSNKGFSTKTAAINGLQVL